MKAARDVLDLFDQDFRWIKARKNTIEPIQKAMYLLRVVNGMSYSQISAAVCRHNHTTALYGVRKVFCTMLTEAALCDEMSGLLAKALQAKAKRVNGLTHEAIQTAIVARDRAIQSGCDVNCESAS